MANPKKYELLLPKHVKQALAKEFNAKPYELMRAFRFLHGESSRAQVIRAAAYERGAQLFTGENMKREDRK